MWDSFWLKHTVLVVHTVESVCSALMQSTPSSVLCLSVCFRSSTLGGWLDGSKLVRTFSPWGRGEDLVRLHCIYKFTICFVYRRCQLLVLLQSFSLKEAWSKGFEYISLQVLIISKLSVTSNCWDIYKDSTRNLQQLLLLVDYVGASWLLRPNGFGCDLYIL